MDASLDSLFQDLDDMAPIEMIEHATVGNHAVQKNATSIQNGGIGVAGKIETMANAFKFIDWNSDGEISQDEFFHAMEVLDPAYDRNAMIQVLQDADLNHDGRLQYWEFCQWLYSDSIHAQLVMDIRYKREALEKDAITISIVDRWGQVLVSEVRLFLDDQIHTLYARARSMLSPSDDEDCILLSNEKKLDEFVSVKASGLEMGTVVVAEVCARPIVCSVIGDDGADLIVVHQAVLFPHEPLSSLYAKVDQTLHLPDHLKFLLTFEGQVLSHHTLVSETRLENKSIVKVKIVQKPEGMYTSSKDHSPHCSRMDIKKVFELSDLNKNGVLECEEMLRVLCFLQPTLSRAELLEFFYEADLNNDGYVDIQEFLNWVWSDPVARSSVCDISYESCSVQPRTDVNVTCGIVIRNLRGDVVLGPLVGPWIGSGIKRELCLKEGGTHAYKLFTNGTEVLDEDVIAESNELIEMTMLRADIETVMQELEQKRNDEESRMKLAQDEMAKLRDIVNADGSLLRIRQAELASLEKSCRGEIDKIMAQQAELQLYRERVFVCDL